MSTLIKQMETTIAEHGLAATLEAIGHAGMEFAWRQTTPEKNLPVGMAWHQAVGLVLHAQQFANDKGL